MKKAEEYVVMFIFNQMELFDLIIYLFGRHVLKQLREYSSFNYL